MSGPPPRPALRAASAERAWWRIAALVFALLALILVPFALWGDAMDHAAPQWLNGSASNAALFGFASLGVALLVIDVVLPVPSSVVAVALCWALGPLWGGMSVAAGVFAAFLAGYGIGRLLPEARLRQWVGPRVWDAVRANAQRHALWWVVLARPLPVLSELTALFAGVWRLPAASVFPPAAMASAATGALYGGSVWLSARAPSALLMFAVLLALPAALWCAQRVWLRRIAPSDAVHSGLVEDVNRPDVSVVNRSDDGAA